MLVTSVEIWTLLQTEVGLIHVFRIPDFRLYKCLYLSVSHTKFTAE
jgi:hypothetical protein